LAEVFLHLLFKANLKNFFMVRVLIVDDEVNIRNMIAGIVKTYCREAEIIGLAGSVKEAEKKIRELFPDLVLLDVRMDDGTGFDLLEQMGSIGFKVIFITAYREYAIDAIKFSALDYILKPIDPDALISAVEAACKNIVAKQRFHLEEARAAVSRDLQSDKKVLLRTAESIHLVCVNEILYCEASGGYTIFCLPDRRQVLVSRPLGEYEESFKDYGFCRVHKSYLVNLQKVRCFEKEEGGSLLMEGGLRVPVASRKKEFMLSLLEKLTE
jgi:two-component system, LytTR family, response regulator